MKIHFLIYSLLLLFPSQATLTSFPNGPFEGYKAYYRGVCTATGIDCDLTPMSSCWNEDSALGVLTMMYEACVQAGNSPPKESSSALKTFFDEKSSKYIAPIADALECERKLPYANLIYGKLSTSEQGIDGVIANVIHYAAVRPEDAFTALKNMGTLAEQGNFEAVGLLDGNFMTQAKALKEKEGSNWRTNAKNSRSLLLKGMCESLGLNCPMESLNCMSEEESAADLGLLYQWFKSVATGPKEDAAKISTEYLLGKGRELMDKIPRSAIECDNSSPELKLINEKLGFDVWSAEWVEVLIASINQFPESCWHYKVSEYRLFENNDLEGVGMLMGLAWYQAADWKHAMERHVTIEDIEDL